MKKEQIMNALTKAKRVNANDIKELGYTQVGKAMQLVEKGLEGIEGLWLFTDYEEDSLPYLSLPYLLLDTELTGYERAILITEIFKYIPHNGCFSLARDVLEEEDNMITGIPDELVPEILEGRVRTVYLKGE